MSIDFEPERQRYRACWREAGRQRSRRFASRADAEAFAASLTAPTRHTQAARTEPSGSGVYSYATAAGTGWRFVYRQSDGSLTTRRGFPSLGPACCTARKRHFWPSAGRSAPSRRERKREYRRRGWR